MRPSLVARVTPALLVSTVCPLEPCFPWSEVRLLTQSQKPVSLARRWSLSRTPYLGLLFVPLTCADRLRVGSSVGDETD